MHIQYIVPGVLVHIKSVDVRVPLVTAKFAVATVTSKSMAEGKAFLV